MTFSNYPSPSEADQELLSAYLDNELTAAERLTLERRLQQEPTLNKELDELRAFKAMVSHLPPLVPPRSFTLDPATVGKPRGLPLFSMLRLGSALATVLLALTFTLDLFGAFPDAAMQPSSAMLPSSAPVLAQESAPAPQPTGDVGVLKAPGTTDNSGSAADATGPAVEQYGEAAEADEEARQAAATPETDMAAGSSAMRPSSPNIGSGGSSSPDTTDITPQPPLPPAAGIPALRWAQIALAALAVACGVGALVALQQGR